MVSCAAYSTLLIGSQIGCILYDYQTLVTGVAAVGVAYLASRPVWRQLRDSNLSAMIGHRETLNAILREKLALHHRVSEEYHKGMEGIIRVTSGYNGEDVPLRGQDACNVQFSRRLLVWYLTDRLGTESEEIEASKAALEQAIQTLADSVDVVALPTYADIYDHEIPADFDHDAAEKAGQIESEKTAVKVAMVSAAYGEMSRAHRALELSLHRRIGQLDLRIATH